MNNKKCPECGTQVNANDEFCPNCGFSFKLVNAIGAGDQSTIDGIKYNLNAKVPEIIASGLNEDIKPTQVAAYKRSMGFANRTDNILFAQNYDKHKSLSLIWDLLDAKSYILSFEHDGILFIGLGIAGQFTGKNAYLSDSEIKEFDFRYGFGKRVITIRSTRGLLKLTCPSTIKLNTLQKQNLANLGELTDQYNIWVDEKNGN
ncbi:zinc ribbon domain-containing protein (plasmid) [Nicoliella spurrieriana]|uniref:Zinc ribbon domain-containing protein n=1 Tax=Nicoliella spurrieriana TaxID=2925830 RepID=A0A976X4M7_9LACO|nr:zinc ribbon domain-containing protein [Nicoliella spurrieriana]UQS86098.1 zinc ribbon domain-containing protein [Nicoliella spurrieriana]